MPKTIKTTEKSSNYQHLEKMPVSEILKNINKEDQKVPMAVAKKQAQINKLVNAAIKKLKNGGRLFYIGSGTSGRLGIVDASECPPTFGIPHGIVIGIIAGGDGAIRKAVEHAEDDEKQGWKDLQAYKICNKDFVIGITASGTTPYVLGAIKEAKKNGIVTGCITCNRNTPLAKACDFPIEVVVGPEFVTGSTRLKAGTAQKLVLNMISTAVMIKLGRVKGNKMVDMQLTNNKLVTRGINMLMDELKITAAKAKTLLQTFGNVRKAIEAYYSEPIPTYKTSAKKVSKKPNKKTAKKILNKTTNKVNKKTFVK
ncbi:MAG: N-acetylmuramic acid 6-phosphate etherase [Bacteroidia bacterium]